MIAFCHTYKTAGTSFNTILRNHYKWHHFDSPGFQHQNLTAQNLKNLRWIYPNLKSIIGHTVKPYSDLQTFDPEIQFYTFLRDPVARSISHVTWFLRWKANEGIFFDDFEKLVHDWAQAPENKNRQCRQLSAEGSFEGVKTVIKNNPFLVLRVEEFDPSLFLFRHWAKEPDMNLMYKLGNTHSDKADRLQSSHPDYLKKVRAFQKRLKADPDLQKVLLQANLEDQQLTTWVQDEIWPAQLAAYPGDLDQEVQQFKRDREANVPQCREPLFARLHRNAILKPLRPWLLPNQEPESAKNSPWL